MTSRIPSLITKLSQPTAPLHRFLVALLVLLSASTANALPSNQSADASNDDAEIAFEIWDEVISGDATSYCSITIQVGSSNVGFSSGDSITLGIYESDSGPDDTLWEESFDVDGAEITSGLVSREFDCSTAFGDGDEIGGEGELEIYAWAEVRKDDCGIGCFYDRPETSSLDVPLREDDSSETNNEPSSATGPLAAGPNGSYISRDLDWFTLTLEEPARIEITLAHPTAQGRLDFALLNESETELESGSDRTDDTHLLTQPVDAGTYYLRVSPRSTDDYNYYDIALSIETFGTDCVDEETDTVACGDCGNQTRACDSMGHWESFDACIDEGICTPEATREASCGNCGIQIDTCSDLCGWTDGACRSEGSCTPDSVDETSDGCPKGTKERTCLAECEWGEWSSCAECTNNDTQTCYSGSANTAGVGACIQGTATCEDNFWGDCVGEVTPNAEVCNDGTDNDCDGVVDLQDPECGEASTVGSPCVDSNECPFESECLTGGEYDHFVGGYCSVVGCAENCNAGGECGKVFGSLYCLKTCETAEDCREGYLCEQTNINPENAPLCVPECRTNADCKDSNLPFCSRQTHLCEIEPPPEVAEEGCACNNQSGAPDLGLLLYGMIIFLAMRKSRSKAGQLS